MDPRAAVRRLLELHDDADLDVIDAELDEAAIEIITALCKHLSFAMAAAQGGKSARRDEARERAAECLTGIAMVLEVWEDSEVEVVGGAYLDGATLCPVLMD